MKNLRRYVYEETLLLFFWILTIRLIATANQRRVIPKITGSISDTTTNSNILLRQRIITSTGDCSRTLQNVIVHCVVNVYPCVFDTISFAAVRGTKWSTPSIRAGGGGRWRTVENGEDGKGTFAYLYAFCLAQCDAVPASPTWCRRCA